jgi:hypothetical protein
MKELYSALSKSQGEFKSIPKNKEVIKRGKDKYDKWFEYKYRYADLDQIVEYIKPVLEKNGITFSQSFSDDGKCLITVVGHSSGEWFSSRCPIITEHHDMQKLGAAITYARRYGLSMAFGITTDDDLDANELQNEAHEVKDAAVSAQKQPLASLSGQSTIMGIKLDAPIEEPAAEFNKPPATYTPNKYPLSDKQIKRLYAIGLNNKWSPMYIDAYIKATYGKGKSDLSRSEYDVVCLFLEKNPCNEILKDQYKDFCVKKGNAVEAMNAAIKSGSYKDHTAEPFPTEQWAPTVNNEEQLPF